jgi:hypothetical protein
MKNVPVDVRVGEYGLSTNANVGAWEHFEGAGWQPTTIHEPHTFGEFDTLGNNEICRTCVVILLLDET